MENELLNTTESEKHFATAARAYLNLILNIGSDELAVKVFALLPYIKTKEDGEMLAEFFTAFGGLRSQFENAVGRENGICSGKIMKEQQIKDLCRAIWEMNKQAPYDFGGEQEEFYIPRLRTCMIAAANLFTEQFASIVGEGLKDEL